MKRDYFEVTHCFSRETLELLCPSELSKLGKGKVCPPTQSNLFYSESFYFPFTKWALHYLPFSQSAPHKDSLQDSGCQAVFLQEARTRIL